LKQFTGEGSTKKPIMEKLAEIENGVYRLGSTISQGATSTTQFMASSGAGIHDEMSAISNQFENMREDMETPIEPTVKTDTFKEAWDHIYNYAMTRIYSLLEALYNTTDSTFREAFDYQIRYEIAKLKDFQKVLPRLVGGLQFASGGYTGERGGVVHPREYVLPPDAVKYYGLGLLEQMRSKVLDREMLTSGAGGIGGGQGSTPIRISTRGGAREAAVHIHSNYLSDDSASARRLAGVVWDEIQKHQRRAGSLSYTH